MDNQWIWLMVDEPEPTPLKNRSSSVGMKKFPTEWKNRIHVPVTTNQLWMKIMHPHRLQRCAAGRHQSCQGSHKQSTGPMPSQTEAPQGSTWQDEIRWKMIQTLDPDFIRFLALAKNSLMKLIKKRINNGTITILGTSHFEPGFLLNPRFGFIRTRFMYVYHIWHAGICNRWVPMASSKKYRTLQLTTSSPKLCQETSPKKVTMYSGWWCTYPSEKYES